MQKIGDSSLTINDHLNNPNSNNKDLMDIPNQKMLVNHVRIATLMPVESKVTFKSMKNIKDTPNVKESLIITKEDNEIHEQKSPKLELTLNNDILEKERAKLSEKISKKLPFKTRRRTDNINNTSVFPVK